jgi:phosphoenolpyruvate---glycerone phosphotransferase subunit DhaL
MGESLRAAILAACDAVEGAREALCELDASTGDGDHGVTMTIGARGVRRQLDAVATDDPAQLVRAAALGMAGAGGAIGPIYGRGLLAVAGTLAALETSGEAGDVAILARCAAAADEAVAALGHAGPGDKTLLDALGPTAAALAEADRAGEPVEAALVRARDAAHAGAEATTGMVATVGRSARFGERSRGTADPGATSFALVVDALVASVLGPPGPAAGTPGAGPAARASTPSTPDGSGDG